MAIVAARRLDSYTDDEAEVTTWRAGVVWGGSSDPFTQWFLTETRLKWDVDGHAGSSRRPTTCGA